MIKFKNELEFISNHHNYLHNIADNIKTNLAKIDVSIGTNVEGSKFLKVVNYTELNAWKIDKLDIDHKLQILADKLYFMIKKGDNHNILPLLNSIVNNKIKKLKKTRYQNNGKNSEMVGKGHFRFGERCVTLNQKQINQIKNFFNL